MAKIGSPSPNEIKPSDVSTAALAKAKSKKTEKANLEGPQPSKNQASYQVDLSQKSRSLGDSYKKALDIAKSTPDVREDRVSQIKKKIADGTYKVDSEKTAEGIVAEAIRDHLAENAYDS